MHRSISSMCDTVHIWRYNIKSHWKVQGHNSTPEKRLESLRSLMVTPLLLRKNYLRAPTGVTDDIPSPSCKSLLGQCRAWPLKFHRVTLGLKRNEPTKYTYLHSSQKEMQLSTVHFFWDWVNLHANFMGTSYIFFNFYANELFWGSK